MIDAATERHLDAWLARAFPDDVRATVKAAMLATRDEDPDRWDDAGWPALFDAAGGWSIVRDGGA